MNGLLAPLEQLESFHALLAALETKRSPVLATGVMEAQKNHSLSLKLRIFNLEIISAFIFYCFLILLYSFLCFHQT